MNKIVIPSEKFIPKPLFEKIQKSIPVVCVDLVFLRKGEKSDTEILLLKRKIYAEIGKWCIIGGRMIKNERLSETIARQAKRELGVKAKIIPPWNANNPIGIFDDPKADPQKHALTLVYPVIMAEKRHNAAGPEFSEAKWVSIKKIPKKLAFIHNKEISHTIKILKKAGKLPL